MRTIFIVIGGLLVAHLALSQIHPTGAVAPPVNGALDIGVVFDVGGRGDKSFNDGAYKGAEKAMHDYGARVHFIEPGDGADREAGLRLLAAEKMGSGDRRRIHLHRRSRCAREGISRRALRRRGLRALGGLRGQDHHAATESRGAQISRGAGFIPRGRARGHGGRLEEGRLRGRHGHPAHPQVRSRLSRRREVRLPRLHGARAVRRRHARSVPESEQGKGARAQPVRAGREHHLPRERLHRARRVRSGARGSQARDRCGRGSVQRGAGVHPHVDGEGRRCGGVRSDRPRARRYLPRRHLSSTASPRMASAGSTTNTTRR